MRRAGISQAFPSDHGASAVFLAALFSTRCICCSKVNRSLSVYSMGGPGARVCLSVNVPGPVCVSCLSKGGRGQAEQPTWAGERETERAARAPLSFPACPCLPRLAYGCSRLCCFSERPPSQVTFGAQFRPNRLSVGSERASEQTLTPSIQGSHSVSQPSQSSHSLTRSLAPSSPSHHTLYLSFRLRPSPLARLLLDLT